MATRQIYQYQLYHIIFEKKGVENPERMDEYFSARGRTRAVERFRLYYPYEEYRIREVARVYSFKDLKSGDKSPKSVRQ